MRVAAAVLVVLAASFVFRMEFWQDEKPKLLLVEDTFETPEEAYAETKKAFLLIAEKMNSLIESQRQYNLSVLAHHCRYFLDHHASGLFEPGLYCRAYDPQQ